MVAPSDDLRRRIREWHWFHTIDLGDGLVTAGNPPSEIIESAFPDVAGRSVLDIGAWDGKHSFAAEAAGARRVVALDHYVWRLDHVARQAYFAECAERSVLPDLELVESGFLSDGQIGRSGFELAHEYLDSSVEAVTADFMTMDLEPLGTFDVVLYFGVLYHMVNPLGALRRLRRVTAGLAVIETAGVWVPGLEDVALTRFFAGDELNSDYGNWYAPNEAALVGMCRAAGFSAVEIRGRSAPAPPAASPVADGRPRRLRRRTEEPPVSGREPVRCRLLAYAYA